MITKICKKCNIEKNVTEYHISREGINGVKPICKSCRKIENHEDVVKNKETNMKNFTDLPKEKKCCYCKIVKSRDEMVKNITRKDGMNSYCIQCCRKSEKICKRCHIKKEINEFYTSSTGKYGTKSICKNCTLIQRHNNNVLNKERNLKDPPEYPKEKKCSYCHITKPVSEIAKCISRKDGLCYYCLECNRKRVEYYKSLKPRKIKERIKKEPKPKKIRIKKEIKPKVEFIDYFNIKCRKCNLVKSVIEYRTNKNSKAGYDGICIKCAWVKNDNK